jgi:hypothetical protein
MTDIRDLLQSAAAGSPLTPDMVQVRSRGRSLGRRRRIGAAAGAVAVAVAAVVGVRLLPGVTRLTGPSPLPANGVLDPGEYRVREFAPPLRLTVKDQGWAVRARSWGGVTLTHGGTTVTVDRFDNLYNGYNGAPSAHGDTSAVSGSLIGWLQSTGAFTISDPITTVIDGTPATQVDLSPLKTVQPAPPECDQQVSCAVIAGDSNGPVFINADQVGRLIILPTDIAASNVTVLITTKAGHIGEVNAEVTPVLKSLHLEKTQQPSP